MNTVFKYIRDFYSREFNPVYFFLILLMLGILIYLNYWHNLEISYVYGGKTWWSHLAGYYLLYFVPFATAFFLQLIFFKDCSYFKNYWFWIILFAAPVIFAFRVNFDFHEILITSTWKGDEQVFWLRSINWVVRVMVVMILIFIIWFIKDRGTQPFYGVKLLSSAKPYLVMLLIMVPLIALASTQKDFLAMYPKAKFIGDLDIAHQQWRWIVYELCYGFDFVSIEFFFRGFLILSLMQICGTHCIIPVACFYCTIHFGKPMAEAISSFWGGLLLGIISFNAITVWGGLMVHLGIAWLMEAGGWLGSLLKK